MDTLDVRTASLALAISTLVSAVVMLALWRQTRSRYPETGLWAWNLGLQTVAVALVGARGLIPDVLSMCVSNCIGVVGGIAGFVALQRFLNQKRSMVPDLLFLSAFISVQFFFSVIDNNLTIRNVNVSSAMAWVAFRSFWIILTGDRTGLKRVARPVGLTFLAYFTFSIIRIVFEINKASSSNEYLSSGSSQVVILYLIMVLVLSITFTVTLMYNKALILTTLGSEERYSKAFHSSPYAVLLTRASDGRIMEVNDGFLAITGLTREQLEGKSTLDLGLWMSADIRTKIVDRIKKDGCMRNEEQVFRLPDGSDMIGILSADPIEIGQELFVLSSVNDITQWRKAETERAKLHLKLTQAHRLESIGTLAGGVAHEINNPLNVVMNYGQLIVDAPSASAEVKQYASAIVNESDRMAVIVKSLLTFSRNSAEMAALEEPGAIIRSTLSLVQATLRKSGVQLLTSVAPDLPPVLCKHRSVQHALMSLIWNSKDAVCERETQPEGGPRIEINAISLQKEGAPWVRISVVDNGTGIAPELAHRVFDPFFTTKARDRSAGLGLSISYGIVKDQGGELHFESLPGGGTAFHVDLRADPSGSGVLNPEAPETL